MKLIVQPDAGGTPVLAAIRHAKKSIDVLIFRFEFAEMADALTAAVRRGVAVRALIAHTNSGGERSLRKLEMKLLEGGVTVSRTADDLKRYHGKMMILDHQILHLYGFNFTSLDMKRSRSFGIETKNKRFVDEAAKLFEADVTRQPYVAGFDRFIVSPENARERLTAFVSGAKKQLLMYDPKISDPLFLRLLAERVKAGVDVRIIGKVVGKKATLTSEKYPGKRLHVRAIVRDGNRAFLGSQSLRRLELERRREIGLIADEPEIVHGIHRVFEEDWAQTPSGKKMAEDELQKKAELAERKDTDDEKTDRAEAAAS